MADATMFLPRGVTCGDCRHHARCQMLFGCPATNTACDFWPIRFEPSAASPRPAPSDGAPSREGDAK